MSIKVTNYLKNLGKSIVYSSIDSYKEETNIGKFISSEDNQELAKEIYHGIRDYKSTLKRAGDAIKSSNVYQAADFGFKSALSDLKTGNFYNKKREEKLIDSEFAEDFGDMENDFDEDQDTISEETPSVDTLTTIKKLEETAEISTDAISSTIVKTGLYNAEVSKQSTSLNITQQAKFFGDLKNGIFNTNNALNNLINFNESAMSVHIENSRKFFDESTKISRENNAILKELLDMERVRFKKEQQTSSTSTKNKKTSLYDLLDTDGLPNLLEYGKVIKENFTNNIDDLLPGATGFLNMDANQLKAMFANPLSGLLSVGTSKLLGNDIKKAHASLDKTVGSLFGNIIAELNYKAKNSDYPLVSTLGKIFGVNSKEKTKINTSNYNKGAIPFDGKTKKSIVEVIPGYLSQILSALTGNTPTYFDFESGKWTTRTKVKDDFKKNIDRIKKYATEGISSSVKNALSTSKLSDNDKQYLLDSIKEYAYKNDTLSGFEQNSFLTDEIKKEYSRISNMIDKRGIANETLFAKKTISDELNNAENNGDDIRNILFNNSDKIFKNSSDTDKEKNISSVFGKRKDEYGYDSLDYLQNIYNELYIIRKFGNSIGGEVSNKLRKAFKNNLPPGLNENIIEKAKKEKEEREKNILTLLTKNPKKESEFKDVKYNKVLDMSRKGMGIGETKLRDIGKKFKDDKVEAIVDLAKMIVKEPRQFITGSLAIADRGLYNLFFEHKFKDKNGKEISGFFDLIGFKINETFDKVKSYLNEKILKPSWEWLKTNINDFSNAFFGKTFLPRTKNAIKDEFKSAGNTVNKTVDHSKKILENNIGILKDRVNNLTNKISENINNKKENLFINRDKENISDEIKSDFDGNFNIPRDGITTISKGEAIIPSDLNPFNPDRDKSNRNDDRRREKNIKEKFIDNIFSNADGTTNFNKDSLGTSFGKLAKNKTNEYFEKLVDAIKSKDKGIGDDIENMDKAKLTARGIVGGGGGAALGGLLLGPLGMIAGTFAGGVINILRDSKSAKNVLLGELSKNNERNGGLISKNLQNKIKKYVPDLLKIGLPSAITGGLLIGTGPLGMALIGSGAVIAKNSKKFQENIFGKDFTIQRKDGSSKTFHKEGLISKKLQDHIKKNIPGIGAAVLGTVAFGPFGGILPNMILGSGIGLLGTSEKFQDLILGYRDPRDPKGKIRRGGLLGALQNGIIKPMIRFGKFMGTTVYDWFKESLFNPIGKWSAVIGRELMHQGKNLSTIIKSGISDVFKKSVGVPLFNLIAEKIIDPIAKKLAIVKNIGEKIIGAPFKGIRYVGRKLSRGADLAKLNQYGRGAIGLTTSSERLMDAATIGGTYKTMEFDKTLANMSAKEAEDLEAKLLVIKGKTGSKKAYDNARQDFSLQMSRYFRGRESSLIKRLRKRFEREDLTPEQISQEANNISNDKNLREDEKKALIKILNTYGKKIETARKAKEEDEELQEQYKNELIHKFGDQGYDFTSKLGINSALNAVHADRINKEAAEYENSNTKLVSDVAEQTKDIEEKHLIVSKKIHSSIETIGSMLAKRFGFATTAFATINTSKTGDVSENALNNIKNIIQEPEGKNLSEAKTNSSGLMTKLSTDGSERTIGSEQNSDIIRDKKKSDEKEKGLFTSLGDRIKGFFGLGGKDKKDKKEGGFLHNLADTIMGKAGGIFSILQGGLLAAAAGPLIIKAIPIITRFVKDNKEEILGGFKSLFKGIFELGKEAVKMSLSGIADSFKNGDFVSGLLQIIATAVIGNKVLGGIPGKVLAKSGKYGINKVSSKLGGSAASYAEEGVTSALSNSGGLGLKEKVISSAGKLSNLILPVISNKKIPAMADGVQINKEDLKSFGNKESKLNLFNNKLFKNNKISDINKETLIDKINFKNIKIPKTNYSKKLSSLSSKIPKKPSKLITKLTDFSSKKGLTKGLSNGGIKFLKDLLVSGISKVGSLLPKLGKKLTPNMINKLSEAIISCIAKNGTKFLGKIAAQVTTAMTGIGAIAILVMNMAMAFDNIFLQGWRKWYDNADVLYNEDLGDDIKYISVLSGCISTLLFSVPPIKWIFKLLISLFGIDISSAQARAQEAVKRYNEDKNSHPSNAPVKVSSVEEYNDLYQKGLLDSVKSAGETLLSFGKDTLTKINQSAKAISKYIGNKSVAAKNWVKNNAKWLSDNGLNWFKNTYKSTSDFISNAKSTVGNFINNKVQTISTRIDNASKTWNSNTGTNAIIQTGKALLGKGKHNATPNLINALNKTTQQSTTTTPKQKYFKQLNYENTSFNAPGDTISQTIGDSGCGPVAAVNALQALNKTTQQSTTTTPNYKKDPVISASNFAIKNGFKGKDTGTKPSFFNSFANSNGVKTKNISGNNIKKELTKGNPIVLEGKDSKGESKEHPFAEYPHYVTATNYNPKNDTVTIQDPESSKNNSKYKLSKVLSKTEMSKVFFSPAPKTSRTDVPKWYGMKSLGEGKKYKYFNYTPKKTKKYGRGSDVPEAIWNYLTKKGLGSVLVAAIMGNIEGESSYNPAQVESNGVGHGICQWSYGRWNNLQNFARRRGTNWTDLNTQLDFLWTEIGPGGAESSGISACKNISDVAACTVQWFKSFERGNPSVAHMGRRISAAQEAFQKQGKGIVTGTTVGGDSGDQTPQNSFGIFDDIMKPLDEMHNTLDQSLGSITSDGPFKDLSDTSSSIFGSLLGGQQQPQNDNSSVSSGGESGYGVQGGIRGSGFDDKYIEVNGPESRTALIPVKDKVKKKFNGMAKEYFEKTGKKLMITGGAEPGVHANGPFSHPAGWKLDVAKPLSNPGLFVKLGQKYNVAIGDENSVHYDLGFGRANVGGPNISNCHPNEGKGKYGLGKHGLIPNNNNYKEDLNNLCKDINSSHEKYGKGIISDTVSQLFNSGALNNSIEGIVSNLTNGNKDISNMVNSVLPNSSKETIKSNNTTVSNNSNNIQSGVIDLLKVAVQLLTTIASNTGKMGNVSKEVIQQHQQSINSAINSIGKLMVVNNQSMMDGMTQIVSANTGMSSDQQHMSLSLNKLASL